MANYLLDTNVVLRLVDRNDPAHEPCQQAVERLLLQGDEVCLASQVLVEFWVVATRPAGQDNGLGWEPAQAKNTVDELAGLFPLLPDPHGLFDRWLGLVTTNQVKGKNAHDARLAAFVLLHRMAAVITLNARDFKRFGVTVLKPGLAATGENP